MSNGVKNANNLDQFYTNPEVAKVCYELALEKLKKYKIKFDLELEPSAGDGSFYKLMPSKTRIGLDLDPKCDGVDKMDFFLFQPPKDKKILTIGNPPFGRISSLAVKFFNRAAEFSTAIAFVVPKTFKKDSTQNKLSLDFRLLYEIDLDKNSFIYDGKPYNVPCCFQIWIRGNQKRKKTENSLENVFFDFVKKEDNPNLAIRRVGGRTGKCSEDIKNSASVSHYFVRVKKNINISKLMTVINSMNVQHICNNTAGVKSISRPELVKLLKELENGK